MNLSETALSRFGERETNALFRYIAGNSRWEIRYDEGMHPYAVRKELVDNRYGTSLNGFYSTSADRFGYNDFRQTRVILSFLKPYGFGHDHSIITSAKPGDNNVALILEVPKKGERSYSSYLIVHGTSIFLEIYDQAPETERRFTKRAYVEVSAELSDVLAHLDEIEKSGILPVPSRYAEPIQSTGSFEVRDTRTRGIYILHAFLNPRSTGIVYARVLVPFP